MAARQRGLSPRNLLAVTFTNKAAGEMARRVEALLAPGRAAAPADRDLPLGLRADPAAARLRHLGLPSHFTIYDEDDRLALVKECMKEGELADRTLHAERGRAPHQRTPRTR